MNPDSHREACACTFLHEAATNPKHPIVFDASLNEFHVGYEGGYSMIYFCPICGGSAPASLRDDMFAPISESEEERLEALNDEYRSLEELTTTFGPPDRERTSFTFKNISTAAHVTAIVENGVWRGIFFHRKQLKRAGAAETE